MRKFLVMDADGTLTDGKIYMGTDGELFKVFDIKDGCGIYEILPCYHILPVVITARTSRILQQRCKELKISELHQGRRDKTQALMEILGKYSQMDGIRYSMKQVAYIGDDLADLSCMRQVKEQGGKTGCPADAIRQIREMVDFVSEKSGGCGAVREYIEWLVSVE